MKEKKRRMKNRASKIANESFHHIEYTVTKHSHGVKDGLRVQNLKNTSHILISNLNNCQ